MDSLNWFFAKHRIIAFLFGALSYGVIFSLIFISFGAPDWLLIIYNMIAFLMSLCMQDAAIIKINKKVIKIRNDGCDPYSLLDACERLLSYKIAENTRLTVSMNKGVALTDIGKHAEAAALLENLNIHKSASTPYVTKMVYYNNLATVYYRLGELEKAEAAKESFGKLLADFKIKKTKPTFELLYSTLNAEQFYASGNYQKALDTALALTHDTNCGKVSHALLLAKIYLSLGNHEDAKKNLIFVIQNGNRLYATAVARELMAQTEKEA